MSWFNFGQQKEDTGYSSSDNEEIPIKHKGKKKWPVQPDIETKLDDDSDTENDPMSLLFVNPRIVGKHSKTYEIESSAEFGYRRD